MSDELEKDSDLTKETVHGVKNVWQRFSDWDEKLADESTEPVAEEPAPEPVPAPVPEPVQKSAPSCEMDEQLIVKMATWLRKKEGLVDKHAQYMQKIRKDPALYNELKNLKRW